MDNSNKSDMEIDSVGVEATLQEVEEWLKDVANAGDIPSHIFPLLDNNVPNHISTTSIAPQLPNDTPIA